MADGWDIPTNATTVLLAIGTGVSGAIAWWFREKAAERKRSDDAKDAELARRQAKIDELQSKIEKHLEKMYEQELGRQQRLGELTRSIEGYNATLKEMAGRKA